MIEREVLSKRDMAKNEATTTVILPKRPLLRGIARLFDWSGSKDYDVIQQILERHRNPPPIPSVEDSTRDTWEAVGDSMRWAIGEYDKTLRDDETNGDEQSNETKQPINARKADILAAMRDVDDHETRVRSALRSADARLRRALASYNMILGEQDIK